MCTRILTTLLFSVLSLSAFSQTILSVNIDQKCIYSGGIMDRELYRYTDSSKVPEWVAEILEVCGATQNFELVESNVENVSAVLDGNTRYLFYSVDFIEKSSRIEVYGAFAHEIGHHVNQHTLLEEHRKREESEADVFMGYFFSKKNFPLTEADAFLRKMPSSYSLTPEERYAAVQMGYEKAQRNLLLKSLAVDTDPRVQKATLPTFTYRPCYTERELPRSCFGNALTLGKVDEKIRLVLDQRGYYNRSYFSVANGFAVVTQMEQYNRSDATIRNDRTRWLDYPVRDNFSGLFDYLTSVVLPSDGYFRLFVVVVTDDVIKSSGSPVSKEEAKSWCNQGGNRLPADIAKSPFSSGHTVSTLVYEFRVPESTHRANQVCPKPSGDALTHLKGAGLAKGFGL